MVYSRLYWYISRLDWYSRFYWYLAASIGTSRLYWYRGVTVLLPGWVIWKYWSCPCKFFSLGSWLVSALSTPNGGEGYNSSNDLNPNTITSIQLQSIQASRPHRPYKTTSKPQPKYCMYQSSHQPPYCRRTWTRKWRDRGPGQNNSRPLRQCPEH